MRMTHSPLLPLSSTGREIGAREIKEARERAAAINDAADEAFFDELDHLASLPDEFFTLPDHLHDMEIL